MGARVAHLLQMNGLFAAVLRTVGFDFYTGGARVVVPPPSTASGPPLDIFDHKNKDSSILQLGGFDHQFQIVTLEGSKWLADVGFGGRSLPQPLKLEAWPEGEDAPPLVEFGYPFR